MTSMADTIRKMIEQEVNQIWVAVPGQVESVNRENFTCNVYLIMGKRNLVKNLPIVPFSSGRCAVYMPLEVNDMVVVFSSTVGFEGLMEIKDMDADRRIRGTPFTPEFVLPIGRFSEEDGDTFHRDEVRELPSSLMKLVSEDGIYLCAPEVLVSDLVVEDVRLLPEPSTSYRGRMHRIQGDDDMLMVCVNKGGTYTWQRVVLENPPFAQQVCNFTVS